MKKNLRALFLFIIGIFTLTSCLKDDDTQNDSYLDTINKNKKRIDSVMKIQKPILETYAKSNFTNPVYDDSTGIWFEVLSPATDNSYTYQVTQSGTWVIPVATVKFKGILLNGTVFDETANVGKQIKIVDATTTQEGLIPALPIAFRPETIVFNSQTIHTGLIPGGLKKGHKIRIVAPSPYCYDNVEVRLTSSITIPKDSPLDYTIEVLNIY